MPKKFELYVLQKILKKMFQSTIRAPGMPEVTFWMLGNFMKTEKLIILLCMIGILIKL